MVCTQIQKVGHLWIFNNDIYRLVGQVGSDRCPGLTVVFTSVDKARKLIVAVAIECDVNQSFLVVGRRNATYPAILGKASIQAGPVATIVSCDPYIAVI